MPIASSVTSTMVNHQLRNVPAQVRSDASIAWNTADWDLQ